MEKIANAIGAGEDYIFAYFTTRNQNLVYVLKLCIIFFFGTLIPAYVFMVIEGSDEEPLEPYDIELDRNNTINEFYRLSQSGISKDQFNLKADEIIENYRIHIVAHENTKNFIKHNHGYSAWTLWNSITYAGTVYTTLGYGELAPNTYTGRTLTMIYALVGIPLFVIALNDFGKFINMVIKFLWIIVKRMYYTGSCRRKKKVIRDPFNPDEDNLERNQGRKDTINTLDTVSLTPTIVTPETESTPTTIDISTFEIDEEFSIPISLAIFVFFVYLFLSSLVYCYWEGWTFFESIYFAFISMSTVGFGDFIPRKPFCQVLSIFVIFVGLALCLMCLELIQEKFSVSFLEDASVDYNGYYGSEEDSFSLNSLDILDMEKDASVLKMLNMEEEEEAKMGVKRGRSKSYHILARFAAGDSNPEPMDVSVQEQIV